ncbi:hypothetical protein LEP1GSC188_0061 [Leptospira weilii serovar Topaz str. LT2116]|uniref:Uncharacterized protein n=1 Tax=Leptospira weilii serovar Topaz str. LT2116 TaxID=1088540 RepID=M3FV80_9LEPT|nr:hypothetical protein LEP1GSC188_0061 [Leptospira weilii serovar Topaz str. LT2116]
MNSKANEKLRKQGGTNIVIAMIAILPILLGIRFCLKRIFIFHE